MKGALRNGFAAATIVALAAAQSSSYTQHIFNGKETAGSDATYDYVVIGGGTGGLAMAYRLAEDGSNSVAVIEAGGFYQNAGNESVVPAYAEGAYTSISPDDRLDNPLTTWGFVTTPQEWAGGAVFHYARGKTLGGTSALNAQNYQRPTVGTLKVWADIVNDSSYEFDSFLPYYQRSINLTEPNDAIRAENATVPPTLKPEEIGGPVQVSHPNWATPIASWAQLAFRELGLMDAPSQINGSIIGSQYNPMTQDPRDQTRESSQTSYLDAAFTSGRDNLKVYTHTMAMKILFDSEKTVTGLTAKNEAGEETYTISANKEIILSAGAFQSPQLLMVSGVGPADTLAEHDIPVIADRPGVGQRLLDHTVLNIAQEVNVQTYTSIQDAAAAALVEEEYSRGEGILTSELSDYLAWENLPEEYRTSFTAETTEDLASYPADWPELEYIIASAPFGAAEFSTPEDPKNIFYFTPVLNKPMSEGNISISSASMADPPLINPNLLSHPTDEQVLVAALKRGRDFFNTTALDPVLLGEELLPGTEALPYGASDEEIITYLKAFNSGFTWHASCSNRMGKIDDPMAVLDSKARVIGVQGLRVVDVSSLPVLPPGHPMSTIHALAEKISEDILKGE